MSTTTSDYDRKTSGAFVKLSGGKRPYIEAASEVEMKETDRVDDSLTPPELQLRKV